jgi:hypothetical protein
MLQFKRFLTFCLLLSVVIPLFTVDAQSEIPREPLWLAADTASEQGSVPQTEVQTVDSHTLDVTITFSGVWAQLQTGDGQSYTRLWHDEYSSYREPGQPALPGVTFNILVPQGAQVEVIQHKSSSHSVSLPRQGLPTKIIPAQQQASKSEPPPPWTPPDPVRYASFSLQPQRWYEVKDTFQMRDYTILPLWINPVRYRPANGEIELLERIELRLTWPENSATSLDAALVSDSPSFDRLVSQIVINPPSPVALDTTTQSGEGYLIITPDEFVEELAPFVTMKQGQGYIVTVAPLSITGYSSSEIKTYIKNAYNTWTPRPAYLLLVGDTNQASSTPLLPATTGLITGRETDLYYATMDEPVNDLPDYEPDIYVGRLPARTQSEVSIMVDKMVTYTTGGYKLWHSNASFIATCDKKYDQIAIESHLHVINNYTSLFGFVGDYPEEIMEGGDQLYCVVNDQYVTDIKTSIVSSLNKGRGIITYSGHGAPLGWYDTYISILNGDIGSLNENNVYSFVASFACETNDFGSILNPIGFGETWMIQVNKGAIGFIGSADYSYWNQDDYLEKTFFDSIFENPLNPTPTRMALSAGLVRVQNLFPPNYYPETDDGEGQYYWETYNLLGDPSQQLWLIPRTMFYLPIIYK